MITITQEFQRMVLDDIKQYSSRSRPMKTPLPEQLLRRRLPIDRVHPNPGDDFCSLEIGPSWEIISNYQQSIRSDLSHNQEPQIEPIIVEKNAACGFMIVNGHHRWYAAKRMGLAKIPVWITNLVHENEITAAIRRSEHTRCVSFDLDEVLICGPDLTADRAPVFPLNLIAPERIRKDTAYLFSELRKLEYDIWVYTGSYHTGAYIRRLFRLHGAKADGIMNGLREHRVSAEVMQAFRGHYRTLLHIDNEGIIRVDTATKQYETFAVEPGDSWAYHVIDAVRRMEPEDGGR